MKAQKTKCSVRCIFCRFESRGYVGIYILIHGLVGPTHTKGNGPRLCANRKFSGHAVVTLKIIKSISNDSIIGGSIF
jgi:hypothetical protein